MAKRGGREAEASPSGPGKDHEEAQAQEGQVGRWLLIVAQRRRPILARTEALKTMIGAGRTILGNGPHACWLLRLGRRERDQREERQEGMPVATSRRGFARGTNP